MSELDFFLGGGEDRKIMLLQVTHSEGPYITTAKTYCGHFFGCMEPVNIAG